MNLAKRWTQGSAMVGVCLLLVGCAGVRLVPLANGKRNGVYFDKTLTKDKVRQDTFGVQYTRQVTGHILSQPLYVPRVSRVPHRNEKTDLVLVATSFNYVYAFAAQDTRPNAPPLWPPFQLDPPAPLETNPDCPSQTRWRIGILATPVVVSRGGGNYTMYVVARVTKEDNTPGFRLYALDVATGRKLKLIDITGPPDDPTGWNNEVNWLNNRPALLYDDGVIYLGFAMGRCDQPAHGWIIAYQSERLERNGTLRDSGTFEYVGAFCTSCGPNENQSGIWQSGSGLAASNHHILAMTGNGGGFSNSFLALKRDRSRPMGQQLVLESNYRDPRDSINGNDVDLGSGGPVVLSDGTIAGGGKEGRLYLLDLDDQGGLRLRIQHQAAWNTYHWPSPDLPTCDAYVSRCNGSRDMSLAFGASCSIAPQDYQNDQGKGPNIHGTPVYFKPLGDKYGYIYILSEKDYVKAYRYDPQSRDIVNEMGHPSSMNMPWAFRQFQSPPPICLTPGTPVPGFLDSTQLDQERGWSQDPILPYAQSCEVRSPDGMPGGFLSLSTYDLTNGILWAIVPGCDTINGSCASQGHPLGGNSRAYLAALDSKTLTPLYIEHAADPDKYYYFTKFMPPVIGGGKVFRATMNFDREQSDPRVWMTVEATPPQSTLVVYGILSNSSSTFPSPPPAPVFQCPQPIPPP